MIALTHNQRSRRRATGNRGTTFRKRLRHARHGRAGPLRLGVGDPLLAVLAGDLFGPVSQPGEPVPPEGVVDVTLRARPKTDLAQREMRAFGVVDQVEGDDARGAERLGLPVPRPADVLR